jgi:hypothetical protein
MSAGIDIPRVKQNQTSHSERGNRSSLVRRLIWMRNPTGSNSGYELVFHLVQVRTFRMVRQMRGHYWPRVMDQGLVYFLPSWFVARERPVAGTFLSW